MHYGRVLSGNVKVGDTVTASIDAKRRRAIQQAHTATHLLHKALQTVLGDHVHQAGSLVEPDFLRFDFTHFSAMTPEELSEVNRLVNESILEGYPVDTKVMDIEEAKKTGATALFGEKYGDTVRVVDMGGTPWSSAEEPIWTTPPRRGCSHLQRVLCGLRRAPHQRPPPGRRPWT